MSLQIKLIYATCITSSGRGVVLRGPSGSGKSDLALRCIFLNIQNVNYKLISDDQVRLERDGDLLKASAPSSIFGKIEVRGLGILDIDAELSANIELVVDLVAAEKVPRLPDPSFSKVELYGIKLPSIKLYPFENSAPLKMHLALETLKFLEKS